MLIRYYFKVINRIHRFLDLRFDQRYMIETCKRVNISDLDDNSVSFEGYEIDELYAGTPTGLFKDLHKPVSTEKLQHATFIDIGSGKSRILIQAVNAGFHRVLGVEFSDTLAKLGRKNCEKAIDPQTTNWKIVTKDARELNYPNGDLVIFMYNPFDLEVFKEFVDNLVSDFESKARRVIIIYNHAHYAKVFDQHDLFKRVKYPFFTRAKLALFNPHPFGAWEVSPRSSA